MFCTVMLQRLEKEEQELFAIARTAFAGDTWFSIANQLMMHDKHLQEMKRSAPPVVDNPESVSGAAVEPGRPRAAIRHISDAQITIPGLQVLPVAAIDPVQDVAAAAARRSERQTAVI